MRAELTTGLARTRGTLVAEPWTGHPFLFRSEDTMLGTYLMALFAMLFAASSALTLIHFVSRLDSAAPEDPAKPSKVEISAAA
jgi:hypothetical protein